MADSYTSDGTPQFDENKPGNQAADLNEIAGYAHDLLGTAVTYGNTGSAPGNSPTQITQTLPQGVGSLVAVRIQAANYFYDYLLYAWQSPFNSGGQVTVLSKIVADNTAGYGDPTFQVSGYALYLTNSKYPSSGVSVHTRVIQAGFAG